MGSRRTSCKLVWKRKVRISSLYKYCRSYGPRDDYRTDMTFTSGIVPKVWLILPNHVHSVSLGSALLEGPA
jgi:hypothetical protein